MAQQECAPSWKNKKCAICGFSETTALEKHHVSYNPEKIIIICANCHVRLRRDPKFKKEVNNLLNMKCFHKAITDKIKDKIYFDRRRKAISIQKIIEKRS